MTVKFFWGFWALFFSFSLQATPRELLLTVKRAVKEANVEAATWVRPKCHLAIVPEVTGPSNDPRITFFADVAFPSRDRIRVSLKPIEVNAIFEMSNADIRLAADTLKAHLLYGWGGLKTYLDNFPEMRAPEFQVPQRTPFYRVYPADDLTEALSFEPLSTAEGNRHRTYRAVLQWLEQQGSTPLLLRISHALDQATEVNFGPEYANDLMGGERVFLETTSGEIVLVDVPLFHAEPKPIAHGRTLAVRIALANRFLLALDKIAQVSPELKKLLHLDLVEWKRNNNGAKKPEPRSYPPASPTLIGLCHPFMLQLAGSRARIIQAPRN